MSKEEIEAAIKKMTPQEFSSLRDWVLQQDNLLWDKQIEEDAAAGRLDPLVAEIERDIEAGRTKPLNGFFNAS